MPSNPYNPTRRQMIALSGAALWAGSAAASIADASTHTVEGKAFASQWRITAPKRSGIEQQRSAIERLLQIVDQQMSPWRDDSDLTRFNDSERECAVAPEVATVARAALKIARESKGWFDPTVGPVVAQWGFGQISGSHSGQWEKLSVGDDTLHKEAAGVTIDLCGIAKGRALDRMATHLWNTGERDFLIDLGGELKGVGFHPSKREWQVAIEDPRLGFDTPAAGLRLPSGSAVATSGVHAQSYALLDNRYSHIIDPHQLHPIIGDILSVSVLGVNAMKADGWATALAAAGNDGPQLARTKGIAALFLSNVHGVLNSQTTGGFDRHMI